MHGRHQRALAELLGGCVGLDPEAHADGLVALAHGLGDTQEPPKVEVALEARLDLLSWLGADG